MANPRDSTNVMNIAPHEIIPLIKDGITAHVINLKDRPELGVPANISLSPKEEGSSVFIEEFKKECFQYIEELKFEKTLFLEKFKECVNVMSAAGSSDLAECLKRGLARIKKYDKDIAFVRSQILERETKQEKLSATLAVEEQNPESKLVAFVPAKPSFSLSRNSNTFFAAHRKLPEKPFVPTDTPTPSFHN